MRAGALRHRITIQTASTIADDYGDVVDGYVDLYADIPAEVLPMNGAQRERLGVTENDVTHKVTIRYRTGIVPSQRVMFDSRALDIESVINVRERDRVLELVCRERV